MVRNNYEHACAYVISVKLHYVCKGCLLLIFQHIRYKLGVYMYSDLLGMYLKCCRNDYGNVGYVSVTEMGNTCCKSVLWKWGYVSVADVGLCVTETEVYVYRIGGYICVVEMGVSVSVVEMGGMCCRNVAMRCD